MLRLLSHNLPSRSLLYPLGTYTSRYGFAEKSGQLPLVIDHSKTFFRHVYGIEMQRHILPFSRYRYASNSQQMKEYREKIPNYVVVLVNKVIEDAQQMQQFSLANKFYPVCTYCKINYHKGNNQIEIIGLHRVLLQNIHQIKEDPSEEINKKAEVLDPPSPETLQDVEKDAVDEEDVVLGEGNKFELTLEPKKTKKIKFNLYAVEVEQYQEPPTLTINHHLSIKLKFLIKNIQTFFPTSNRYFLLHNPNETLKLVYGVAGEIFREDYNVRQIQAVLEENSLQTKIDLVQQMLKKSLDCKLIENQFKSIAENNLRNKKFFEYYSQIFKIVKKNLDGKKGKQLFIDRVTQEFNQKNPPKEIKEAFEQQAEKYTHMEETAAQAGVIKKYLEDLSRIPYSIKSQQIFDLEFAQKTLEEEHYGMKDVKDAILEIIAVGKLKGSLKGKIFCFVGGPGLGKTTIAKSIAKALGRKFYNISLGGVTDSSVLKGHRRTYVAAYAGKIIEALKHCGTNNPVILLDEIDKMGSGSQGDPRSQLLQILDPNQNSSFVDNYIDLPVDLSNVLFICSANYQQNISKPLLDRVEKIRLSSYTDDEKLEIFKRHLLRRAIDKTGVQQNQFILTDEAISALVTEYSLGEPGVRVLEKNILKILERLAYKIVEREQNLPILVSKENLREYLGSSYFHLRNHKTIGVGVAISLGGGYSSRLTYIESFKKQFAGKSSGKRGVLFTGSLGDVFKEAMNISYTYARNFLLSQKDNRFLFQNEVHIHAPDGASKKDGSTDSLTICTSLVSLALQKPVRQGIAMTGELTLHGKILRTRGIKEKILLARRQKIKDVIIPFQNRADVQMLADNIRQGINFHYVREFREAYELLFQPVEAVRVTEVEPEKPSGVSRTAQLI